jgi:hypothetical protein
MAQTSCPSSLALDKVPGFSLAIDIVELSWFSPRPIERQDSGDVSICIVFPSFDMARTSCPSSLAIGEVPGLSGAADVLPLAVSLPVALDLSFMYLGKEPNWFFFKQILAGLPASQ